MPPAEQSASWRVRGSYFESCNCDAICPCRTIDGVPGGRSTHGVCLGVLSWRVEEGHAGSMSLDGLAVALALRYSDDEPRSPWSYRLYVDEGGDQEQRAALEQIFAGRLLGDIDQHAPWIWKESSLLGVRAARIEIDHTPRRQRLRIADHVEVRVSARYAGHEQVSCVISGHDRAGEELVVSVLRVSEEAPLEFEYADTCGYASTFDYRSAA